MKPARDCTSPIGEPLDDPHDELVRRPCLERVRLDEREGDERRLDRALVDERKRGAHLIGERLLDGGRVEQGRADDRHALDAEERTVRRCEGRQDEKQDGCRGTDPQHPSTPLADGEAPDFRAQGSAAGTGGAPHVADADGSALIRREAPPRRSSGRALPGARACPGPAPSG